MKQFSMHYGVIIGIILCIIGATLLYTKDLYLNPYYWYNVLFSTTENNIWEKSSAVPWETIRYHIVLEKDMWENLRLNKEKIKEKIKISQIFVDGEEIQDSDKISWKENTEIIIIGEILSEKILEKKDAFIEVWDNSNLEEKTEDTLWEISNISLQETHFLSDFNHLVEIQGSGIENIAFINIGDKSFSPQYHEGKYFISLPKDLFWSGDFFTFYQDKQQNIIPFWEKVSFTSSQESINISHITPKQFWYNTQENIVLQGRWFNSVISLQLSNNIIFQTTNFEIVSDKIMIVSIPKDLSTWNYFFNVMTTQKIHPFQNHIFTITN